MVSILIPTYNRAAYLRDAIRSGVEQTHQDTEIIVLDDCSPDDTGSVVREFTQDPRVRYLRNDPNLGIARNWQTGIAQARGDYFCILHDDDTFDPAFVERLLQPLTRDESLILSFCDHWVMDASGRRLPVESEQATHGYKRDILPEGLLHSFAEAALVHTIIPAGGALYRRSLVTPDFVDSRARGSIDMWLLYRCLGTGAGAYYVPERLMNYRSHAQGMSRSMPFEMIEGHIFRYRAMLGDAALFSFHAALQRKLAEALEWHGMALLRTHQMGRAREAFGEATAIHPTAKSRIGRLLAAMGGSGGRLVALLDRLKAVTSSKSGGS